MFRTQLASQTLLIEKRWFLYKPFHHLGYSWSTHLGHTMHVRVGYMASYIVASQLQLCFPLVCSKCCHSTSQLAIANILATPFLYFSIHAVQSSYLIPAKSLPYALPLKPQLASQLHSYASINSTVSEKQVHVVS